MDSTYQCAYERYYLLHVLLRLKNVPNNADLWFLSHTPLRSFVGLSSQLRYLDSYLCTKRGYRSRLYLKAL